MSSSYHSVRCPTDEDRFCHIVRRIGDEGRGSQADYQAPDGGRADDQGKRWYPPSGNGILAASQGLYPKKGSVSTGDVTSDPSEAVRISAPDEGEPIPDVETKAESNGDADKQANGNIAASASGSAPDAEQFKLTRPFSERGEDSRADTSYQWRRARACRSEYAEPACVGRHAVPLRYPDAEDCGRGARG